MRFFNLGPRALEMLHAPRYLNPVLGPSRSFVQLYLKLQASIGAGDSNIRFRSKEHFSFKKTDIYILRKY